MSTELKNNRFLILSEPRSGSNNVGYVLSLHPELEVGNELLHPRNGVKPGDFPDLNIPKSVTEQNSRYHWIAAVPEELRHAVMDRLFQRYNAFKIHNSHVPAAVTCDIVERYGCKAVITYRADRFDQAISNFVATVRGKWHSDDNVAVDQAREAVRVEPLLFLRWIEMMSSHRLELWNALSGMGVKTIFLEYETVYSGSFEQRVGVFLKVLDLLSLPRFGQLDIEDKTAIWKKMRHYLDPQSQKMTETSTVESVISNVDQLRQEYKLWMLEQPLASFKR